MYLYVDLPKFDFPVVFSEQESLITLPPQPVIHPPSQTSQPTSALPPNLLSNDPHLWKTYDPEAWRENPVEIKHRKLLRSQRLGDEGRDLKPGPADRDRLNVSATSHKLNLNKAVLPKVHRKYSACRLLHHSPQWIRTYYGSFVSLSFALPDLLPSSSSASLGRTRWKQNKRWRSCYRCGGKKLVWMMPWSFWGLISHIRKFGHLQ